LFVGDFGFTAANAVVLSAGGSFSNDPGSLGINLFDPGASRWLIYSAAPGTAAQYGGLDSANTAVWGRTIDTLPPDALTMPAGNRYVFAFQPTLTFTSTNVTKNQGTDATATVATAFTVTGVHQGVTGAFLPDDPAAVFAGTPDVTSLGSPMLAAAGSYPITVAAGSVAVNPLSGYNVAFNSTGVLTVNATNNNNGGGTPSQTNPPANTPTNPGVNVSFQNQTNTGPVNVSFTPGTSTNIITRGNPPAGRTNNGFDYQPISQFDPNQYSQFRLPDFADRAGLAAIFAMIARAGAPDQARNLMIDTFWNGNGPDWNGAGGNGGLNGRVTFSNGGGNVVPNGSNGSPLVAGQTDIAQLLGSGPAILCGAGNVCVLAIKLTDDGRGIIANDPISGRQVVLSYDPNTRTVGGVTGIFDARTQRFASLDNAGASQPQGAPPLTAERLAALQGFTPATFVAVTVK
jgi:hypothetical protein